MKTRALLLSSALALSSPTTFAEESSSDLCSDPGIAFAFFNGGGLLELLGCRFEGGV